MGLSRLRNAGALCLALLALVGAGPAERLIVAMPAGVHPFPGEITLQYAPPERFTYSFRSDIDMGVGRRVIAEGWVMEGTARREGDGIAWAYRLSNIGRDEVTRLRGSLDVTTDAWGEVRRARVTEDRWARPGRPRSGADAMFDAQGLDFPLCCCPRGPIRHGQVIVLPRHAATMPPDNPGEVPPGSGPGEFVMHSVAAGILERGGRQYLAVRHTGHVIFDEPGAPGGSNRVDSEGYLLLDTATCMPVEGVRSQRVVAPGGPGKPTRTFGTTRRVAARFEGV